MKCKRVLGSGDVPAGEMPIMRDAADISVFGLFLSAGEDAGSSSGAVFGSSSAWLVLLW